MRNFDGNLQNYKSWREKYGGGGMNCPGNSGWGNRPTDYGPEPLVINIEKATLENNNYRTALWTGTYLQVTLMSIKPGEDIGLEIHPDTDQFLRLEEGQGLVMMGKTRDNLDYQRRVGASDAIMVPAGTWHNVINKGRDPLKLYSIYAPPHHPHGTVQPTKQSPE